jgi:RNA polymerase sigma-70 factor, ECF subfamily
MQAASAVMQGLYLEYNSPETSALIERCQTGDRDAFDQLVARYQRYVFNLVYQHLGRTDDLEDVSQEVFLRVYKFIRKYKGTASLESWIYKIVLNYCRTHARRKSVLARIFGFTPGRSSEEERSFEVLDTLPAETYDPAKAIEQRRQADDIMQAVRALPDIYRDVLVMREVNELSYEEIAQILGISLGTVKSRISRARDLVRSKVRI